MKNPLNYQVTEYDCGPTTVLNAVSCLFKREEIPPVIIKHIMTYCLDSCNDKGEFGKGGTSRIAMMYMSNWFNQYHTVQDFPIRCEYLTGAAVTVGPDTLLTRGLRQGAVAVVRLWYGCWHYVLFTGADRRSVHLFDPYFRKIPFAESGITVVSDRPSRMNRKVEFELLEEECKGVYALGPRETREAVLMLNLSHKRGRAFAECLPPLPTKPDAPAGRRSAGRRGNSGKA